MNRGGSTPRGRGQRQSWRPVTSNATFTPVGADMASADVASNGHISGGSDRKSHGSWQAVRHGAGGSLPKQHDNVTSQGNEGQTQRSSFGGGGYNRGGRSKQWRASDKNFNDSNHSHVKSVGPSFNVKKFEGNVAFSPVDEVVKPLSEGVSESSSLNLDQSLLSEVASSHLETNNSKSAENMCERENSESSVSHERFDICPPRSVSGVVLKPSLLSKNREKRKDMERSICGPKGTILRSGMVLLKNFLSISEQVEILRLCRTHGMGPAGFYQPHFPEGGKMHLKLMCFGAFWDPESNKYGQVRPMDGAKPPPVPQVFLQLVDRAIFDAHTLISEDSRVKKVEDVLPLVKPDICLVNYYATSGRLGLHQDKDESQESLGKGIPIVSFSIGDSAEFLYSDQRNVETAQKITLDSGDVLIFGGKSRHIFHGVSTILPDTAPKSLVEETNFRPGRINLTFRQHF